MNRAMSFVMCSLLGVLIALPARADDPPKKLTAEERKELEAKWKELSLAGVKAYQAGKHSDAVKAFEGALEVARELYPKTEFPDGHADLALSLNAVAKLYWTQGKLVDAEVLLKNALEMNKRLFKGDHTRVANNLNNTAMLLHDRGKFPEAESLCKEALEMRKRLFKGDHHEVVNSLDNLALLYKHQEKLTEAEPLLKEALEMRKRLFKGDHHEVAISLTNIASLYVTQKKLAEAEPLLKEALEMAKRLFKGDHPEVVNSLNNLGLLYGEQGKFAEAEQLCKEALEMRKRLFKGDHPKVAINLYNLALLYKQREKLTEAEPLLKEALEMEKRLFKGDHPNVATTLGTLASLCEAQGKLAEAEPLFKDALEMQKRLFKGDHPDVATNLNNLASLYKEQGKLAEAEPLFKDALEMRKRLFKGDHRDVANSLNNSATLCVAQGKLAQAESLLKEALEMVRRLFKGDHRDVEVNLNNLALLYREQGKLAEAEMLHKEALDMTKRLFKGDCVEVARGINNLATVYRDQGRLTEAEPLYKEALEMHRRLLKDDHPSMAHTLNNVAALYKAQGKLNDAESLLKEALEMQKRLCKGDHPEVARKLSNLAALYKDQGLLTDAESLFKEALDMSRRLLVGYAKSKSEGEALTHAETQPLHRDGLLSVVALRMLDSRQAYDPGTGYAGVWSAKGTAARVSEQRQLQARAASTDPAMLKMLNEVADARRRRAELLFAPPTKNPGTLQVREADLKKYDATIADLTEKLAKQMPAVARSDKLNNATLAMLQKELPADAAFVDFYHYTFFEFDNTKPVGKKRKYTQRYAAFVVTRDKVAWVDLETAAKIELVVNQWREAITTPPYTVPADLPVRVRALVWEPVRKHIPSGTKVVYVCPDADLTKLPWAALPGDKPGTILLEDFAIATIPHAPFLLDSLWPADKRENAPTGLLAVGGVSFGGEPQSPMPGVVASRSGDPLVDPKKKLNWPDLPGAKAEAEQIAKRAADRNLTTRVLTGTDASTLRLLDELPKVKYAHIATHGFFADAQFRSVLQVDPKEYERTDWGERRGRLANSPMLLSGLVFAGANLPGTPGRGIVTGESLIDRDLSGLELAVLSACETGLGDVAGGEGVFGLQRAFHVAGTRNVVASLWKVPDTATAALMGEFYRALWDENLPPILAVQKAQLAVYRADPKQFAEMARRGPGLGDTDFDKTAKLVEKLPVNKDGKNPPIVWAAFSLSGIGR